MRPAVSLQQRLDLLLAGHGAVAVPLHHVAVLVDDELCREVPAVEKSVGSQTTRRIAVCESVTHQLTSPVLVCSLAHFQTG